MPDSSQRGKLMLDHCQEEWWELPSKDSEIVQRLESLAQDGKISSLSRSYAERSL